MDSVPKHLRVGTKGRGICARRPETTQSAESIHGPPPQGVPRNLGSAGSSFGSRSVPEVGDGGLGRARNRGPGTLETGFRRLSACARFGGPWDPPNRASRETWVSREPGKPGFPGNPPPPPPPPRGGVGEARKRCFSGLGANQRYPAWTRNCQIS